MATRPIDRVITAGVAALVRMQAADGSFPLQARTSAGPWTPCGPLFATAAAVLAAGKLLPPQALARSVGFIRRCRRPDGLWEFDPALGVPPDSDDTSCALAALALHGGSSGLENGAGLLRSYWRPDGGPFRTWHGEGMWAQRDRDDPVVNCNIIFALACLGAPATPAELAAVRRLVRLSRRTRYYCAPAAIAYAARRAGLPRDALPPVASARPPADDLLACAQWLCGMRQDDPELVAAVLAAQRPDGAWPAGAWCTGAFVPPIVWGSPAVSTAYALEALTEATR